MGDSRALKQVVGDLFDVAPESIDSSFSLRHPRFQSSAGRGVLVAAIKRHLGVYSREAFTAATYGDLEAAIFGSDSTPTAPPAAPALAVAPEQLANHGATPHLAVRIGLDMEMVDNMPEVPDFWTADFYRTHFTAAEIAYCLRQEQPRVHFAARWCAKEALAKCDAAYAGIDPATIQVIPRADGQPILEVLDGGAARAIPFAVSLSHTPLIAVAVVAAATPPR